MWRCPSCGEHVDNQFDACWNCGTAQDGTEGTDFRAEPSGAKVPDFGPEPEEPPEAAADAASGRSDADRQRVVELCSAADVAEARGLCDLLQEDGIRAKVVGEYLGGAAGSLPLGEPIAPRIWVHEADLAPAREIIGRWREQAADRKTVEQAVGDELPEWGGPVEQEEGPLPSDVRFRFLSQGFYIVGLTCVLLGGVHAWQNGKALSIYSGTVEGERIAAGSDRGRAIPMPGGPDQPIGKQVFYETLTNASYAYVVGHTVYYANVADSEAAPVRVPIHYNPHDPAYHVVGTIMPAWLVLVVTGSVGVFLDVRGLSISLILDTLNGVRHMRFARSRRAPMPDC